MFRGGFFFGGRVAVFGGEPREPEEGAACCPNMFGMFKKDPAEKLRKEHARLLSEAHRLSTVDRAKSDEMTAKAAEVEAKLLALQNGAS